MNTQCDHVTEVRRPGILFIDAAAPGDMKVKDKELEKIEEYQSLKEGIWRLWDMKSVLYH